MNILHLLSQNQLTGAEVYATSLIEQQLLSNYHVFQISNGFFFETKAKKIKLAVETKSILEFISSVRTLRAFVLQNKIQVIHTHSRAASKLAYWALWGLKIGRVSSIHGRQHVSFSKKIKNIYGDFLIAICENIQDQLINELKYNPARIKIIENGIDPIQFKFKIREKKTTILQIAIIGRATGPKKIRTEIFVSEFSKILDQNNIPHQFYIVGGKKEDYNLSVNNIHFETPEKLSSDFFHKFDLICGSGRVCLESILCGRPVIAFGENLYCGLVTENNYLGFKKSNFGDIGSDFKLPTFNYEQAKLDFKNYQSINLKNLSDLVLADYGLANIAKRIERIYESSYFLQHYPKWIPILMYHKIPLKKMNGPHQIFVTRNNFEKHLRIFKFLNFKTMTFSDLSDFRTGQKPFSDFPRKPLILTFDDGYEDNISNADPLLKKYDFKAQVFLLANPKIKSNIWDQLDQKSKEEIDHLISGPDRKKWITSNFLIGSHGLDHQKMPPMNLSQKLFELTESKIQLENEFSKPIDVFAFTYGDTNFECAKACEMVGYKYGLNTDTGGFLMEENPYSIFRVSMFPNESFFSIWKKTSSWYRKYYYLKRGA